MKGKRTRISWQSNIPNFSDLPKPPKELMARYLIQKAPRLGLIVWVLNGNEICTLSVVGCLVYNAAVPYRGLFGLWIGYT